LLADATDAKDAFAGMPTDDVQASEAYATTVLQPKLTTLAADTTALRAEARTATDQRRLDWALSTDRQMRAATSALSVGDVDAAAAYMKATSPAMARTWISASPEEGPVGGAIARWPQRAEPTASAIHKPRSYSDDKHAPTSEAALVDRTVLRGEPIRGFIRHVATPS
jgi:hypothetical protein